MAEATSLPTAEEIAQLTDAFRRDPTSDAFVQLGERLLDLGRPRDAIEVGARGLKSNPSSLLGRLMVARAFMSLHQWKEAQAELLKVVKADRNSRDGFLLLGEVLMRRSDYERALPVLQHAQNLSPADPSVLSLLRRARAGQPLDPPRPIPTPKQPRSAQGSGGPRPPQDSQGDFLDEMPTHVAGDILDRLAAPASAQPSAREPDRAIGRVDVQQREVVQKRPAAPSERVSADRGQDARARDDHDFAPVEHHAPPQAEDPLRPLGEQQAPRAGGPSSPPPVRPRVLPAEKPKDAAQKWLRQSAAVGEQYLNSLLTGGLLDVPNVRVSEVSYDVSPGKKWGRSTRRLFIYLFVVLFAGVGGGGFWYWYAEQQRKKDVEQHLQVATELIDSCDHGDLRKANAEARAALERDKENAYTMAVLAEITGLSSLLYGEYNPSQVEQAIDSAAVEVTGPEKLGYRELVIARAANTLSVLDQIEGDAETRLQRVQADLEGWLETSPDDRLARWLLGRSKLAAGDRRGAFEAFQKADARGEGPAIAAVDLANHHLDEGDYETAMTLYDRALAEAPNHALAFVGRSLARSERRVEIAEAMADLNVGLAEVEGPRLKAWKQLALAYAKLVLEDYDDFEEALEQAKNASAPRFVARIGLARMRQGRVVDAARARSNIRWFASDPEPHPLVVLLDAELLLARGLPADALEAVADRDGLRTISLRGRAHFDLGQADQALAEFEKALAIAPEDVGLQVWTEAARMLATSGEPRRQADETLDSLGRQAKAKSARYIHGVALMRTGKSSLARDKLEMSLEGITSEYPNPLAYRAHVAVAELDYAAGKADAAVAQLEKAFELNPGFLPARDLMGRILADVDADAAREHLVDVIDAGVASAGAELALVKVLMPSDRAEDRDAAVAAIKRAQSKGAELEAVQEAIAAVDEALFEELGVPEPK